MLRAIDGSLEVVGIVDDAPASGAYGVVEFRATVRAGVEEHRGPLIRALLLVLANEPQAEILDRVPQQLSAHGVATRAIERTTVVDVVDVAMAIGARDRYASRQCIVDQCPGAGCAQLVEPSLPTEASASVSGLKVGAWVVIFSTPAVVFFPNSVPCGPRSRAIWSISIKSRLAMEARPR